MKDPGHWLHRLDRDEWMSAALGELRRAEEAYARGEARAGVAGCKRAAGMALNAALVAEPVAGSAEGGTARLPDDAWGRTYVDHLVALEKDEGAPEPVRAACKALIEAVPPGSNLLALRSRAGDERVVEAAKDVMAHAYAIVARARTKGS